MLNAFKNVESVLPNCLAFEACIGATGVSFLTAL